MTTIANPLGHAPRAAPDVALASDTLLARLGGRRAVDLVVDRLYRAVLDDPLLAPVFAGVDMVRIRSHQRRFLAQVFDAAAQEPDLLRRAHAAVVARHGLGDIHFDAVLAHLAAALRDLGVAAALQAEVLAIAQSTRSAVLAR